MKRKKNSLVGSAVQKNNIQNGGKFKAKDSRLYLFYVPRRLKTSVLTRGAHGMTQTVGDTRLTHASCRQRTDVALEVRYSSYEHHVQFAKHNVQENVPG